MSPEQCNALFTRMGDLLGDAFGYARRLGVKTCIGTEVPLTIPTPVKERLQAAGKNPGRSGRRAGDVRGDVRADRENPSLGLLLALDGRELDVEPGHAAADRRGDGRFSRGDRGGEEGEGPVHAGHVRLGAGTAAKPGAVRPIAAERDADGLHQPPGRQRAGRAGVRQNRKAGRSGPFRGWKTIPA